MKTTIAKLLNSDKALSALLEQKLPLVVSLQLGKVISELEPIYKKANEVRLEIFDRLGTEVFENDKPTGKWHISNENMSAFEREMSEAFGSEIELLIPSIDPTKIPDGVLTAKDIITLDWLWLQ